MKDGTIKDGDERLMTDHLGFKTFGLSVTDLRIPEGLYSRVKLDGC